MVEKVSGNLETGYVLTGITSDAVPISGSGGYPLTKSVDVRYGSISAGVYPQNGGGLYVYVEGPLTSVRLGGSWASGYRQSVNYPVQFRIKDGVVFWRGVVEKVSGYGLA